MHLLLRKYAPNIAQHSKCYKSVRAGKDQENPLLYVFSLTSLHFMCVEQSAMSNTIFIPCHTRTTWLPHTTFIQQQYHTYREDQVIPQLKTVLF